MYANPEEVFGGTGRLLGLIELIYSAVDDVSLWPIVLDQIASALNGTETVIWTNFSGGPAADIVSLARMDPAALVPYAQYYATKNVLAQQCDLLYPDGRARFGHRAVPDAEFEKTEFYNDYFHPNGMHHSIGVKVPLGNEPPAYIACMRRKHEGEFEDREGTILETLVPHLRRALMLHLKLTQLQLNTEGLKSGLDAFGHAVFGLNGSGRVVVSNRQAEKIAAAEDGIQMIEGCLSAIDLQEDHLFQTQLREAVACGRRDGFSSGGSLLVRRSTDKPALRVTVAPMQAGLVDHYGQLAALVFISDPSEVTPSRSTILRDLYSLTPSEARIADLLADGNEVIEVAAKTRTTRETARFHVKRVLSKTETHRQSELIRLVLSLPGQ